MATCALCSAPDAQTVTLLPGDDVVEACATCAAGLVGDITPGPRWMPLAEAVWTEDEGTKIATYRLLALLKSESWAADALENMWLEPEVLARAKAGAADAPGVGHKDSNGVALAQGDTVVLIKDLPVKGSSLVAKRGTAVRNIRLVRDNADHIEGRVEGQQIVILCKFVKKST